MRYVESVIQKSIVTWFRMKYPEIPIFSIPNGYKRSKIQGKRLVDEGLTAGAADLFVPIQTNMATNQGLNRSNGLFIEVKTPSGRQSKSQKIFQQKVEKLGYQYLIIRSLDEITQKFKPTKQV